MVDSNIKCDACVKSEFDKIAVGKPNAKPYRYIVFKIEKTGEGKKVDYTKVVIDKIGERNETFNDMKQYLKETNEPRYVVYDMCFYTKSEHQRRDKLVFVMFIPSQSPRIEKMVYSTTSKAVKQTLGSAAISLSKECDCVEDVDEDEFIRDMD